MTHCLSVVPDLASNSPRAWYTQVRKKHKGKSVALFSPAAHSVCFIQSISLASEIDGAIVPRVDPSKTGRACLSRGNQTRMILYRPPTPPNSVLAIHSTCSHTQHWMVLQLEGLCIHHNAWAKSHCSVSEGDVDESPDVIPCHRVARQAPESHARVFCGQLVSTS